MQPTSPHDRASHHRDSALRRLRRTTTVALAVAGALVAAFAGLAARALPGRHSGSGSSSSTPATTVPARTTRARATPPPLVPAQSSETPSAPASPPVQTQAPPVVVSGGT